MEDIIKKLYYGEINEIENEEIYRTVKNEENVEGYALDRLLEKLTKEQEELFDKYWNAMMELRCKEHLIYFKRGFKMAMQFALEGLS